MANKERNKRSARKARAAEREAKAALQEQSEGDSKAPAKAEAKKEKSIVKKDGIFAKIKNYIHDVKVEMSRVTWPDKPELVSYSVAVVCMLIVVGFAVWAVDSGLVALLLAYTGLRG